MFKESDEEALTISKMWSKSPNKSGKEQSEITNPGTVERKAHVFVGTFKNVINETTE